MSKKSIVLLIERYLEAVAMLSRRLAEELGVEDLFLARRRNEVPRAGPFGDGGEFQFHGIGCTIDDGSTCVNFDFYADGRFDGFDAWRLHTFAEDNAVFNDASVDTSRGGLEREIQLLVASGDVRPVEGSNLFKLVARD